MQGAYHSVRARAARTRPRTRAELGILKHAMGGLASALPKTRQIRGSAYRNGDTLAGHRCRPALD